MEKSVRVFGMCMRACTVGLNPLVANFFVPFYFLANLLGGWGIIWRSTLGCSGFACMCMHGGFESIGGQLFCSFLFSYLSYWGVGQCYGEVP